MCPISKAAKVLNYSTLLCLSWNNYSTYWAFLGTITPPYCFLSLEQLLHPTVPSLEQLIHPTLPSLEELIHPTVPYLEQLIHPTVPSLEQLIHPTVPYLKQLHVFLNTCLKLKAKKFRVKVSLYNQLFASIHSLTIFDSVRK